MNATPGFSAVIASLIGGWEITLLLAIGLILFGVRHLPELLNGIRRGMREFLRAIREVTEELRGPDDSMLEDEGEEDNRDREAPGDDLLLWIAQGFDVGRIPVAPGTFGTLVGILWFVVLLVPGSLLLFLAGTMAGLAVSVWCCGEAERILGEQDPGSVVLDEIVAMPICFAPWVVAEWWTVGSMPLPEMFVTGAGWWRTGTIFLLFRIMDIWKPWPVRQSQNLPGGWGVTADDVLAAIYVAMVSLLFVHGVR